MNYTVDLSQKLKPCKSKICKACGLYLKQGPVYEMGNKPGVFWVGLSAVQFEDNEEKIPLSPFTASGALINEIEKPFTEYISFYKTNLVKCAPTNGKRIRYPLLHEMQKCFPNLEWELKEGKPAVVFLLGKQVSTFIIKKLLNVEPYLDSQFNYLPIRVNNINFIPIHHPSYILVYKRKHLQEYINSIQKLFEKQQSFASSLV